MAQRNFKIELLSPAKDKKCAFAAIDCGADAVYIGASDFGARKNAGNSINDIKEIIDYAHIFGVKVYVTINTLLFDNELDSAKKLIEKLYEINTDAIIIQDMGLLELDLPPIPLHSSTQCHNASVEKIKFLENIGFQRAILARELSIEEIKNIAKETTIELEAFVQGALCVSYSGQCYLSHAIGGRSANRGECAQPCRKKYSLIDANDNFIEKDKHLLCLKDFNASDYLEKLIDAGVSSFKIEGRLKDENYIKNTVSFYRKKIDSILVKKGMKRASYGISSTAFEPNLSKTFNRGFCQYFLNERNQEITSFLTPKNQGEFIGTIQNIGKKFFTLNKGSLNINDGITFLNEKNELCGTKIEKIDKEKIYPNSLQGLKKGTKIYRNVDFEFLKKLEQAIPSRKIPVNFYIKSKENFLEIKISDNIGNEHKIFINKKFEPAQNQTQAKENLKKQFSKLGSTEFVLNNIELILDFIPFIKINELNEYRRKIIEEFKEIRAKNYKIKKQTAINYAPFPTKELTYKANITNEKAKIFYEKCGCKVLEYGLEHNSQKSYHDKIVMTTKHCLKYSCGFCSKNGKKANEPLFLIDETGKKYKLQFDCKNCQMNIIY